ncbi:MAG TPA: peptidyl-alpha-hydroxyglycine alpha-amidating lyase family protein [Candidatus Dormibacteraeota bacterium]|nr:peptidyl-alpha-hydroxyglycine alpha-amidating lyase family protein [Candidatus Dormibacteraeota bacterium]
MIRNDRGKFVLAAVLVLIIGLAEAVCAQTASNSLPNPYRPIENWAKLPVGRTWGSPAGLGFDHSGNLWVLERCGGNTCAGRPEAPVLQFDPSGRLLKSFGAGMMIFPHGLFVDKDQNVWVTDADGKDGKGQQVIEFSPEGKVLMTLGKKGVAGDGPDTFNRPSAVVVAPNGDIFVADGHGGDSNARIVKFSKEGKFIKAWGKKGSAPGEFNEPHAIAMDSKGRIYVADRGNNRIQIFDQDGKFLKQWTQFGRPSGIFIDRKGLIYVTDNTDTRLPEWKKGIRIGKIKDGVVTAFIPEPVQHVKSGPTGMESVTVDARGNIYVSDVGRRMIVKYVKQ